MNKFATNAGDVLVENSHGKNALSNRPILIGADLPIDAEHTVQIHHFSPKWILTSMSSPNYDNFSKQDGTRISTGLEPTFATKVGNEISSAHFLSGYSSVS